MSGKANGGVARCFAQHVFIQPLNPQYLVDLEQSIHVSVDPLCVANWVKLAVVNDDHIRYGVLHKEDAEEQTEDQLIEMLDPSFKGLEKYLAEKVPTNDAEILDSNLGKTTGEEG